MKLEIFGLALLLLAPDAIGCSCVRLAPVCERGWKKEVVFTGHVLSSVPGPPRALETDGPTQIKFPVQKVQFAVDEGFRGVAGKTIEIETGIGGGDCGIRFQVGTGYLVYAERWQGRLYTGVCSGTRRSLDAAEDLAYLRSLNGPTAPAGRVFGFLSRNQMDYRFSRKATQPITGVVLRLTSSGKEWKAISDPSGDYEFSGLPSGDFGLSADLPSNLGGGELRTVHLAAHGCSDQILFGTEKAVVSGRVLDDRGKPAVTADVALSPVRKTAGRQRLSDYTGPAGEFEISNVPPDDYWIGVNIADPPRPDDSMSVKSWPPTFFPGTGDRSLARVIHVESGQAVRGLEVQLPQRLKARKISGTVVWSDGSPAGGVWVELRDDEFEHNVDLGNTKRDGTFAVIGLEGRSSSLFATVSGKDGAKDLHSPKVSVGPTGTGPVRLVLPK